MRYINPRYLLTYLLPPSFAISAHNPTAALGLPHPAPARPNFSVVELSYVALRR